MTLGTLAVIIGDTLLARIGGGLAKMEPAFPGSPSARPPGTCNSEITGLC